MGQFELGIHPHRRFNPLRREWVLVSPHRTQRPWQGQVEPTPSETSLSFDPHCYLCPGNERAGGARNPQYTSTFVFDNDFAALRPDTPPGDLREGELLRAQSEAGRCRVVCFSPQHDLTLARMSVDEIKAVVDTWCEESSQLAEQPNMRSVQIFENRGAMMGCSNPHPHCQIWANENVPDDLAREVCTQQEYFQQHNSSLLEDYRVLELEKQERLVCANEYFAIVVPFWAIWPYETLVISQRRVGSLPELDEAEREGLAQILREVTIRYDNLFKTSFPYTMGFHQRPTDGKPYPGFHLHAHFYPPLLRSATVKKFMVGYELLAMPQRDISPELAAKHLRDVPNTHYLDVR
ncbi:MAG TPA: UDP-glucose--hexose-1-phosphate uridylyltransferase [Candidatus Acidoferrum sp.]|nr:UDP-glucose--hexose-1-phosphate uridylyltransferase [Candidatus Acidoferrum sp.]